MATSPTAEAFPAGEILADEIEARGWTQTDFAEVLGRPVQFVSEIVNGKKELTRESAAQIGAALDTSPEIWLNLQDKFYLWKQEQNQQTQAQLDIVRLRSRLFANFPIAILAQRGFIHQSDPRQQERDICDLYEIDSIGTKASFALAARKSDVLEPPSTLQRAWFACVRQLARKQDVSRYDEEALVDLAGRLPHLLKSPAAFADLPDRLAAVGVCLIYLETFPTSKLDGGAQLLDGRPVIGLSGRWKRLDIVLFTLMHEIAHIVLGHANEAPIVDDDSHGIGQDTTIRIEKEANDLAGSWIFPSGLPDVPARLSSTWINLVAEQQDVHPIVLVGRLQKLQAVPWRTALVKNAPSVGETLRGWQ